MGWRGVNKRTRVVDNNISALPVMFCWAVMSLRLQRGTPSVYYTQILTETQHTPYCRTFIIKQEAYIFLSTATKKNDSSMHKVKNIYE